MTTVQATEDNMNIVRSLIQQGFDAIAEASKLAETVAQIKAEVEELRKSLDYLRARNAELDNLLTDVRRQRDDAQREVQVLKEEAHTAEREKHTLTNDRDFLQRQLTEAQARIVAVTKERDDAQLRVLELEEKLEDAQGRLDTVEQTATRLFNLIRKPSEPAPEVVTPVSEAITSAPETPKDEDKPWWQKAQATGTGS